ncbi:MAG: ABC transporter ATP-binding protein [Sedimentibacter sp.]|uniref:ABC transporter ATP-binding protein n=1 Tax=Sedimentibacter sp. TaxID=1960295 RepID=UPI00298171D9|nr:ABC transporter ATP-binding protein [Sedimentibacter sp.]MDW5299952.1 ABC transporter ATP-binding protein [Sedimentibacter sp.]
MSLVIENLTKEFGKSTALNNISVEIKDGEFIAILGPSGCGKTTLLRTIAGFIQPTKGLVRFGEEIYSSDKINVPVEKRDLGMVFQSFALWPHMTVKEQVEFPLKSRRNKNMSLQTKRELVEKAIESTGLTAYSERLPGELSGGQRQRVALARAIVGKPSILLMDEPLSSLDAELKISMRKEIQDIHKLTGATIIYVTHDQSEALAMADRIIIMKDGKIEQIGTPMDIYKKPKTIFSATFVSKCNLIKGIWEKEKFCVNNSTVVFENPNIESCFIQNNVYPIRPEELLIATVGNGIKGTIVNKQYNGREIHYKVKCDKELYNVFSNATDKYDEGDEVILIKKEELNEIAV